MEENNVDLIATNEWYAQQIRKVGEYFIKHANELASGPKKGHMDIHISVYPNLNSPMIDVNTTHTIK